MIRAGLVVGGLKHYDFHAHRYDLQLGRFTGLDTLDQFPSGYTGRGNDPANMVDPSGMWSNYRGGGGPTDPYIPKNPDGYGSGGIGAFNAWVEGSNHGNWDPQIIHGGGGKGASISGQGGGIGISFIFVKGTVLPEVYVIEGKPDWQSWGKTVNEIYGQSLGWDFRGYGGMEMGITFSEAMLWYQFGGGGRIDINLSTIDFSEVKMSDFNSRGLATVRLDTRHFSNVNDALVHGTVTLQRIDNTNEAKIALNAGIDYPQLRGQPAGMFNFEMQSWREPVNWIRNPATFIGSLIYGSNPVLGYVGGTPFPIYYHGTIRIRP